MCINTSVRWRCNMDGYEMRVSVAGVKWREDA